MKFDPAHPTAVFLGPSLDRASAARILPANYYRPVRMGDVYRLTGAGVDRIVIIDGVFHSTASVWHREIVDAMANGIEVVGAASMGALRAAELFLHGMVGLGTVFQWYRDGVIDGDDEVALLHGDESAQFRPMTEPLVNVRATLGSSVAQGLLSDRQRDHAVARLKELCYAERHYEVLFRTLSADGWPEPLVERLERFVASHAVDLKRTDAMAVLEYCARTAPRAPAAPPPELPRAPRWAYAATRAACRGLRSPGGRLVGAEAILDLVARDEQRARSLCEEAALHFFLSDWARAQGVECPADFRARLEPCPADRAAWLRENGWTETEAGSALDAEALVAWILEKGPAHFGLAPASGAGRVPIEARFLEAWAARRGIRAPPGVRGAEAVRRWLLDRGPEHFGCAAWSRTDAVLTRLRMRGEIAALARQVGGAS